MNFNKTLKELKDMEISLPGTGRFSLKNMLENYIKKENDMKVYIDMDGTLTEYNYDDYKNNLWKVHPEVLCKEPIIKSIPKDWIILTKTATPKEAALKKEWAHHYFPDNKIICLAPYEDKSKYAKGNILLDDYKVNLRAWKEAGGYALKVHNNVNRKIKESIPQLKSLAVDIITYDRGKPRALFYDREYTYSVSIKI